MKKTTTTKKALKPPIVTVETFPMVGAPGWEERRRGDFARDFLVAFMPREWCEHTKVRKAVEMADALTLELRLTEGRIG